MSATRNAKAVVKVDGLTIVWGNSTDDGREIPEACEQCHGAIASVMIGADGVQRCVRCGMAERAARQAARRRR